jgi:hypothetical protein
MIKHILVLLFIGMMRVGVAQKIKEYYVESSLITVVFDLETRSITLKSPQKNVETYFEYTEYVTSGDASGLAFLGLKHTIVVSDQFITLSSRKGPIYVWYLQ